MKRNDRICSFIFFLLALIVIWQSLLVPVGRLGKPGPGFLPLGVGLILALLSVFLWIEAGLRQSDTGRVPFLTGEGRWPSVLLTVGSLLAYALLMEFLGFIICTVLLLFFLFRFVGSQKWWLVLTEVVLVTWVTHLIFKVSLKVQLPVGLFRL